MADLSALRAGLIANLEAIPGVQWSAYRLADPTPPAGHVFPSDVEYDTAFARGGDAITFTIQVFVGLAGGDIGAQKTLDEYLATDGPLSVKAAVETDKTLGGACDDLRVTSSTGDQIFVFQGRPDVLGADWTVEIET